MYVLSLGVILTSCHYSTQKVLKNKEQKKNIPIFFISRFVFRYVRAHMILLRGSMMVILRGMAVPRCKD